MSPAEALAKRLNDIVAESFGPDDSCEVMTDSDGIGRMIAISFSSRTLTTLAMAIATDEDVDILFQALVNLARSEYRNSVRRDAEARSSATHKMLAAFKSMPSRHAPLSCWHDWLVHPDGDGCPDGCEKRSDPLRRAIYNTLPNAYFIGDVVKGGR